MCCSLLFWCCSVLLVSSFRFHSSFFFCLTSLKTQLFRFCLSLLSLSVPRIHLNTLSFSLPLSLPRLSLYTSPSLFLTLSQLHSSHAHRLGGKRETKRQISRSLRTHSLFDYLFVFGTPHKLTHSFSHLSFFSKEFACCYYH